MKHPCATVLTVVFAVFLAALPAVCAAEEMRTANRAPEGTIFYPHWLFDRPEHYEFLSTGSNHDTLHQHPAQWEGQDWDPSAWNDSQWTPEAAVTRLFEGGVFRRQYMRRSIPVLELGPRFYQLSDLDRRRSLKLLADYTGVFEKGAGMIELRDWYRQDVIGNYTPQGMHLN